MKKLYIVPEGGLANRMRAIASGVSLARKTDREMIVIWHRDRGLNASFSDIFHTEDLPFDLRETGDFKYYLQFEEPRKSNLYISRLTAALDGKERICQNVNREYISDEREIECLVKKSPKDYIIKSGLIFHEINGRLMSEIFRYNDNVSKRIKEITAGIIPDLTLQIRRTDNVKSIAYSPLAAFENIAEKLIKENNKVKIFVATDDELTKSYFKEKFMDNILYNKTPARRDTKEGIIDAAAELYIMSSSRHIYGSYWSSYSEIAALMGGCPLTVVKR